MSTKETTFSYGAEIARIQALRNVKLEGNPIQKKTQNDYQRRGNGHRMTTDMDYEQLDTQWEDEIGKNVDEEDSESYDSEDDQSEQVESGDDEYQEHLVHGNDLEQINVHEGKKNVRGPTKMESLWKDHDENNKIQLKFNIYGQACGLKTCKLTNFIGYLVRGKELSLAATNWSKVDKAQKEKLWMTIQGFFVIDETYKKWVPGATWRWRRTTATKWATRRVRKTDTTAVSTTGSRAAAPSTKSKTSFRISWHPTAAQRAAMATSGRVAAMPCCLQEERGQAELVLAVRR